MSNTDTTAAAAPPSAAAPAKKKRGPAFWAIVTVLAAIGGVWLANFIHRAVVYTETEDAYVSGHVHMISSRLDGSVTEVLVEENQTVKAGQVLARLDPFASQVALDKARAALDSARADALRAQAALGQAKAQELQAKAQVAEARAQVGQSSAQLDLANVNNGRDEKLFQADTRTISQSEVDSTHSVRAASEAAVTAMKASLEAAEARVRVDSAAIEASAAQVGSADARVKAQEESVRDAERGLTYATITAPTDGRIGNKNIEVGNRVQVGQPLFALVEPSYWVTANFKETQLRGMSAGQEAEVTIDAIGGHVFTGKLDSIAPATGAEFALLPADNATGNFTKVVQRVPVKILFDKESTEGFEDRLRPGLSAVVSVKVK
ncbi:MAG TPA: HlyD family secretion protein [Opitutaceae bacterium]